MTFISTQHNFTLKLISAAVFQKVARLSKIFPWSIFLNNSGVYILQLKLPANNNDNNSNPPCWFSHNAVYIHSDWWKFDNSPPLGNSTQSGTRTLVWLARALKKAANEWFPVVHCGKKLHLKLLWGCFTFQVMSSLCSNIQCRTMTSVPRGYSAVPCGAFPLNTLLTQG